MKKYRNVVPIPRKVIVIPVGTIFEFNRSTGRYETKNMGSFMQHIVEGHPEIWEGVKEEKKSDCFNCSRIDCAKNVTPVDPKFCFVAYKEKTKEEKIEDIDWENLNESVERGGISYALYALIKIVKSLHERIK